jgi:enamine deaminase RidA (YjgF/YER057c/UK114 family)
VFAKIQKALQDQGLDMKDVVKMTVFLDLIRRQKNWTSWACSRST